jgi:hypothetical protein
MQRDAQYPGETASSPVIVTMVLGEIAVITGTTHGIGRVTARELAKEGRVVVTLCREWYLPLCSRRIGARLCP